MIIEKQHHRARVVKGWAFMSLDKETVKKIRRFLDTGNTDYLPYQFTKADYSIYLTK